MYNPQLLKNLVSTVSVLFMRFLCGVKFTHLYKSVGTAIVLYHFNTITLLLVVNVRQIVPHAY